MSTSFITPQLLPCRPLRLLTGYQAATSSPHTSPTRRWYAPATGVEHNELRLYRHNSRRHHLGHQYSGQSSRQLRCCARSGDTAQDSSNKEGGKQQDEPPQENLFRLHPSATYLYDTLDIPPRIALTREEGKNDALRNMIETMYSPVEALELPCVRTVTQDEGYNRLVDILSEPVFPYTWVIVTSPESALTFISAWRAALKQQQSSTTTTSSSIRFAVVGKATGDVLRAVGFDIPFTPSKATGKALVAEFPQLDSSRDSILYPVSKKASSHVVDGFRTERQFDRVTRVDTYSTEQVDTFDAATLELCQATHIATFASPSAVKAWANIVGVDEQLVVACIGETSATAARKMGFTRVHYPDKPGLDGWMIAVNEAMKVVQHDKQAAAAAKEKQ